MAWGSIGTLGASANKTGNQSSSQHTLTNGAAAGTVVVVEIAVDNFAPDTGIDEGAVSSITDSVGGNSWQKAREWTSGGGGAQSGSTISKWFSTLTNAIPAGGTITVNFTTNTSRDASAISAWNFSINAGSTVSVEATSVQTAGGDPFALDATTPNAEFLRIRATALEGVAGTYTPTSGWTALSDAATSGAGAASNMWVTGEFLISTGTGASSNPTASAVDNVSVYVAFKENLQPAPPLQAHAMAHLLMR